MNQRKFIDTIAPLAVADMHQSGVLASITIAQAALETGWGKSVPDNNLFGIKSHGAANASDQQTLEYVGGRWITIVAGFRVYECWADSVADHGDFLRRNGRYAKAGFFDCCAIRDYTGAARALQTAGYATDPGYAGKLISIIESWGLNQYDREADMIMDELRKQIEELQGIIQTLQEQSNMLIPEWAREAVDAAVAKGLIDTPNGGSYDFYRMLTILHRKGVT